MTILVIVIIIAAVVLRTSTWKGKPLEDVYKNKIIFFGHRGLKEFAPENTLPSYKIAVEKRLKALELDVRTTKDLRIICSHNIDLERETTGTGYIDEIDAESLKKAKAGKSFPKRSQTNIPFLLDVLNIIPRDVIINIEIKTDSALDLRVAKEVLKLIKSGRVKQSIIVSSFNPIVLRYIKIRSKSIPTGFIYEYAKHFKGVFIARPDCLHPEAEFVDNKLIQFCRKRRIHINAWTVNNPHARDWLIEKGVRGIITDNYRIAV